MKDEFKGKKDGIAKETQVKINLVKEDAAKMKEEITKETEKRINEIKENVERNRENTTTEEREEIAKECIMKSRKYKRCIMEPRSQ